MLFKKDYKLEIIKKILYLIPVPLMNLFRPIISILGIKYLYELLFWKRGFKINEETFENSRYERIMLAMAEETDDMFLKEKIVADFGCGPGGSLTWVKSASLKIGIDVLADRYADNFKNNIITHGMIYLKSTEKVIPLPSEFIDVMFTLNAIDHVDDFSTMCSEIIRVLKSGGVFIGSFNLEEPPTPWEPQSLTVRIIQEHLLDFLNIESYRISRQGPDGDEYSPFFEKNLSYNEGEQGFLWVRGKKR